MSSAGETNLGWNLDFEPDEDAEEELAEEEEGEYIDKALLTDETVKRCRVLATIKCIQYGTITTSPNQSSPAVLQVINFTFHPYDSRVKEAFVELDYNKGSIAILQPESIDDSESEETIRKKLHGELQVGYPPVGVNVGGGAEWESERTKISALRIRGSGSHTSRATWTLKENLRDKKGIHLNFTAVVIAQNMKGKMEVDFEIRARLGATMGNILGTRRIITRKRQSFDGETPIGFRPLTLDIHDSCFKGNA